jgi:UDP-N-acetylglucosamine acyltransferase
MTTPSRSFFSARAFSEARIHPTAIVSPEAVIGEGARIGAYSVVESGAVIGENTEIRSSSVIYGEARIGRECVIHPGAIIGAEPQDLKFDGEPSLAWVGDRTVVREYATVHRGTRASGETRIGENCLIMAYVHVAHDCVIGDNVVLANAAQLGGHVRIEDCAVVGGVAQIHQFCAVGAYAMIGAGTKITKDIPPFALADGNPARFRSVNSVGLRRRGFSNDVARELEIFYRALYFSGFNIADGVRAALALGLNRPETLRCVAFIQSSKRGVCRASVHNDDDEEKD